MEYTEVKMSRRMRDKEQQKYVSFLPANEGLTMMILGKEVELDEKCWKGYEKKGMKTMFGKRYPNCVKKEEVEVVDEAMSSYDKARKAAARRAAERNRLRRAGKMGGRMERETYRSEGGTEMHHKGYRAEGAYMGPDKKDLKQIKKMDDPSYAKKLADYEKNMDPKKRQALKDKATKGMKFTHEAFSDTGMAKGSGKPSGAMKDFLDKKAKKLEKERASQSQAARNNPAFDSTSPNSKDPAVARSRAEEVEVVTEVKDKKGKGSGKKDACYHKVKSRYSVWPSAYASGALVKCRKVGAANWGNSSKKEQFSDWKSEFIWEDGDSEKKLLEDDMKGMSVKSGHKRPTKSGAGMTAKGVAAYRRRNPGSKLKTAVTTKPSKLKKGSKAANRRKSYCARSAGQMKKFPKAAKDPNSRLRQARRRWNC